MPLGPEGTKLSVGDFSSISGPLSLGIWTLGNSLCTPLPVSAEIFSGLSNLDNLRLDDNKLRCTVHGDPDALISLAKPIAAGGGPPRYG